VGTDLDYRTLESFLMLGFTGEAGRWGSRQSQVIIPFFY
jgi:hypothetical protein